MSADFQELDFEDERLIRPDGSAGSAGAIGEIRGNEELDLSTFLDELDAFRPARDHTVERELDRLVPFVGAVKFRAVEQGAAVVDQNDIRGLGSLAGSGFEDFVLESAGCLLDAGFGGVFGKEGLALFECGLCHGGGNVGRQGERDDGEEFFHVGLLVEGFVPLGDPVFLRLEEGIRGIEDFNFENFVTLGDGVDNVLPLGDLTENGVLAVQPGSRHMGDEKLAAIGRGTTVRHREDARLVVLETGFHLVFKGVARAACPGAGRVAALDHEIRNHAMEGDAVVIPALGEIEVVGNGDRSLRGKECAFDVSLAGFD